MTQLNYLSKVDEIHNLCESLLADLSKLNLVELVQQANTISEKLCELHDVIHWEHEHERALD